jgi:hypothetical protein
MKLMWSIILIVGMEEEVGRKRLGRESVAHSSARRERAKNRAVPPTRARGRMKEVSSTAENHPEPAAEHDFEIHSEANPPLGDNAMEEVEENEENEEVEEREDGDYVEEAEEDEHGEEEEEEPTPPPSPPTARGRQNPPQDAPAGGYPGGPTDLSLLPSFGKHVANALWKGQVSSN